MQISNLFITLIFEKQKLAGNKWFHQSSVGLEKDARYFPIQLVRANLA